MLQYLWHTTAVDTPSTHRNGDTVHERTWLRKACTWQKHLNNSYTHCHKVYVPCPLPPQEVAICYSRNCKATYRELSNLICSVMASRQEVTEYDQKKVEASRQEGIPISPMPTPNLNWAEEQVSVCVCACVCVCAHVLCMWCACECTCVHMCVCVCTCCT